MSAYVRSLLASPLVREPHLALRKVAKRLGLKTPPGPRSAPDGLILAAPADWNKRLRGWFQRCGVSGEPLPATHVFGQDFPRELLLKILRDGPEASADLRGDIKLAWDFARSHHFPINAYLADKSVAVELAEEARELMAMPARSPFWSCPMDVAIRAVNWVAADALLDGALAEKYVREKWAAMLWQHLDVIWRNLEAFRISGNHYLSNLLGLVVLGRVLPDDPLAARCLAFGRREWPRALLAQTSADGGLNEASLRYHAFVAEMALLARLFDVAPWPAGATERLEGMCQVLADHQDGAGDVFAVGDDDSGRVIAVDHASQQGRMGCLLCLEMESPDKAHVARARWTYPKSGWWTARCGPFIAQLEFGGVGLSGEGGHAHDDDLSVCLSHRGVSVLCDPGSYLYTPDRTARDWFRASSYHTTVRLLPHGTEPEPLRAENCFVWRGRNEPLPCEETADGIAAHLEGICRSVRLDDNGLHVSDKIRAQSGMDVWWFFHLHPDVRFNLRVGGAELVAGDTRLSLDLNPPMELTAAAAEFSPRYGTKIASTVLRARADASRGLELDWRVVTA